LFGRMMVFKFPFDTTHSEARSQNDQ